VTDLQWTALCERLDLAGRVSVAHCDTLSVPD
jgi:hypothetical protein